MKEEPIDSNKLIDPIIKCIKMIKIYIVNTMELIVNTVLKHSLL